MTILRRPDSAYSPVSGLRVPPAYAASAPPLALQLWLAGVEQVSCAAAACEVADDRDDGEGDNYELDTSDGEGSDGVNSTTTSSTGATAGVGVVGNTTSKGKVKLSTRWECSDLTCSCIPGTKYCGGTEEVSIIISLKRIF